MIPKLIHFFKKNKLAMHGKPFVIYHTYDTANGITKLSVCIPIKEAVFTSEGSDITSGRLYPFQAVKTILTGDYSHSKEAWKKTFDYISKNNLSQNTAIPYLELYSKNMDQIANPSQWITEIYIPIQPKAVVVYKPKPEEVTPAVPDETPSENATP
jgi:effector-binding domain-containing protein